MYSVSCLCGGVQFKIYQDIDKIFICHCQQCQKAQGSAFVAVAIIERKNIEVINGENLLNYYSATQGKKRVFCRNCASPLYSYREDLAEVVRLRVGVINEPLNAKVYSHAFTRYKANWFEISQDNCLIFSEKNTIQPN
ncbi:GFA family protein [Acinetobacter sp. 226-4]|uniref:GFA family protein n=1 Tax=Acinetobacter sp. 226-4 TaxID=2746719 RepID=UPI002579157B|nr:GFA family protein [Acinetobacter sp. 226-4]MDM1769292.1 GFA family protein [Acinetobacter sp. 226-4]